MASGNPKPIEFEAGKMNHDPVTKKVVADKRRGKVRVYINQDGEKHFEWIDIQTNNVENDLYVFESDAKFDKVNKGPNRVYYLHFQSYEEKYFFWLQEKDTSKDEELCKRVNDLINFSADAMDTEAVQPQPNPPTNTSNQGGSTSQNVGQGRGQGQVQGQAQGQPDFSKIFSDAMKSIQQQQAGGFHKPTPNLNDILTPQFFESIVQDKEYQDRLLEYLPDKQQTSEGFKASLKSAQLQQAIDALDEALNSEEGMTVLMSLGFDPSVFNQARDGTEALLLALEKWAKDHPKK